MTRRRSRAVGVGAVTIGGGNPPVIQSMTNTATTDVESTVRQIIALQHGGARLVRLAVPDRRSLHALPAIQKRITERHCNVPLIADVHFSLAIAREALDHVEKLRINPGNLLELSRGRSSGKAVRDSAHDFGAAEALADLLKAARDAGRAVRVGVNQGSLSRRIVDSLGVGPEAMVASALEYVRVADTVGFGDLVISLKSSDPWTVVKAHRDLAGKGVPYPFHVGVTEAGWGLQGRARSAAGLGPLLREGLVDTLRVSLADPPEQELPVAQALVAAERPLIDSSHQPGSGQVLGVQLAAMADRQIPKGVRFRMISEGNSGGARLYPCGVDRDFVPVIDVDDTIVPSVEEGSIFRIVGKPASPQELADWIQRRLLNTDVPAHASMIQLPLPGPGWGGHENLTRSLAAFSCPLCWEAHVFSEQELMLALADLAQLHEAGLLQWLELQTGGMPAEDREHGLDVLQGLGTGDWCAEIIACPQCGRNRIDVPGLARAVRIEFGHLAGLKLAVMGCIVNGPGEMVDADFGFVGQGEGLVALYAHGEMTEMSLPVERALEHLKELVTREGY